MPATFTVSAQEHYLCPTFEYAAQFLIPISAFFGLIFIFDLFFDSSRAQEREMRRQIELEKKKESNLDVNEEREWIMQ
jgi:hypothetical protein